jgi:hypothetical protein
MTCADAIRELNARINHLEEENLRLRLIIALLKGKLEQNHAA